MISSGGTLVPLGADAGVSAADATATVPEQRMAAIRGVIVFMVVILGVVTAVQHVELKFSAWDSPSSTSTANWPALSTATRMIAERR